MICQPFLALAIKLQSILLFRGKTGSMTFPPPAEQSRGRGLSTFQWWKAFPVLGENSWETRSEFLAHFYLKSAPQKTDSWREINWSRCRVKKYPQPKSWVVFYSAGIFRTSSLGGSTSSNPKRTAPRRRREEAGFREVLQQRLGSLNVKRYLLIKENQISQVKKFRTFPYMGFPGSSAVKNLPANQETRVRSLGWEDPLGKEVATHNIYLAWEISWTAELGGLQSMWLQSQTWLNY